MCDEERKNATSRLGSSKERFCEAGMTGKMNASLCCDVHGYT